jgi:hypothetical protein
MLASFAAQRMLQLPRYILILQALLSYGVDFEDIIDYDYLNTIPELPDYSAQQVHR